MTKTESQILDLLKENARLSNEKIAKLLKLSEDEVQETIAKLEAKGVIAAYALVLNDNLVKGQEIIKALVEISVSPEKKTGYDAIAKRIYNYPNVTGLYLLSGQYDFLVVVEGASHKEISAFVFDKLATQPNITSTNTHFVFKKYKEQGAILDQEDAPKRVAIVA